MPNPFVNFPRGVNIGLLFLRLDLVYDTSQLPKMKE